jgi:nucleoside 2-deoxyribosyltransferase
MIKIYLAGAMTGLSVSEMSNWREYATDKLGLYNIETLDPCRPTILDCPTTACYQRDLTDIKRSDAVLMHLGPISTNGQISLGTMWEAGWITALGKPLVIVMPDSSNELYRTHPFILQATPFIVKNISDGIDLILEIFNQPEEDCE